MADKAKDTQPVQNTIKAHYESLTPANFTYMGKEFYLVRDGSDVELPADSEYVQGLLAQGILVESKVENK